MSQGHADKGAKLRAAVLGWPITQSRSPLIHGAWLAHYGLDGTYEALAVRPEDLAGKLRELQAEGYAGANITVPHKQAVLALCQTLSPAAAQIGAVNTLVFGADGSIHGTNTDAFGFTENLKSLGLSWTGKKALVLGAGGAARAVLNALSQLALGEILVLNRTLAHAEDLAQTFTTPACKITAAPWSECPRGLDGVDLLVNTTSLGMVGQPPLKVSIEGLKSSAVVTDLVYNPLETDLLGRAQAQGNATLDGLGMLLHQARPGFEAWFGVAPEVSQELRAEIIASLEVA